MAVGMRLRLYRQSLALLGIACLLVLLAGAARMLATRGPDSIGSTMVIPLSFTRTLSINVWLRDRVPTFWPEATGSVMRPGTGVIKNPGSVTVALWFQDRATASVTRVALMRVPSWPLLLLAAGCTLAAFWLRPSRGKT